MQLVQLLECNSTLGNCCSDFGLVTALDIGRKIVDLLQIVVPIILIIMLSIQFIKLIVNPESKKGIKPLVIEFSAVIIIFFLPTILDVVLGILPDSYQVATCWEASKYQSEISKNTKVSYIAVNDVKPSKFLSNSGVYEKGKPTATINSAGAQKLIAIATAEIGNHESNGSHSKYEKFNGLDNSQPWCAAFVTWCAGQAGLLDNGKMPRYVGCDAGAAWFKSRGQFKTEASGYNPKGGEIIFFGSAADSYHTGIVVSSDAKNVYTIEGNTSCEGEAVSKCGGSDGVSKKTRSRSKGTIYGYGIPNY